MERDPGLGRAIRFVKNRLTDQYDEGDLDQKLAKEGKSLEGAIEEILKEMGKLPSNFNDLMRPFLTKWDDRYSRLSFKKLGTSEEEKSEEETSEEETSETKDINQILKGSGIAEEIIPIIAGQYQTILNLLKNGSICARWKYLGENYQKNKAAQIRQEVLNRLLGGLCVVVEHLYFSHDMKTAQKLKAYLLDNTIILHGSYLFGANNYPPNDMDIIIPGCTCKDTNYTVKLPRHVNDEIITIGSKYSVIDVMVGIPLCIQPTEYLTHSIGKALWKEVVNVLKQYLNSIGKEDSGKDYRKLVNCAIALQYTLELNGQNPNTDLQNYINQANLTIIGAPPKVTKATIQTFLQIFRKYKDLT